MSIQVEVTERASDGMLIPVASCDIFTNVVDGVVEYEELEYKGVTYRRTYIRDAGNITETKWVRQ